MLRAEELTVTCFNAQSPRDDGLEIEVNHTIHDLSALNQLGNEDLDCLGILKCLTESVKDWLLTVFGCILCPGWCRDWCSAC